MLELRVIANCKKHASINALSISVTGFTKYFAVI